MQEQRNSFHGIFVSITYLEKKRRKEKRKEAHNFNYYCGGYVISEVNLMMLVGLVENSKNSDGLMSSSQNMCIAYALCYIANIESLSISWMSDIVSFSHFNTLLYILKNHKPSVPCNVWMQTVFIYILATHNMYE